MRTFHGKRTAAGMVVTVEAGGVERPLGLRLDLRNHSPTGFEVGYAGSGPAQLALAICATVVGDRRAEDVYQAFKERVVANIRAAEWWLDEAAVRWEIEQIERARSENGLK